jgi:LCP family protein required for cell wall assembly
MTTYSARPGGPGRRGDGLSGLRRLGKELRRPSTSGPGDGPGGRRQERRGAHRKNRIVLRRRWPRRLLITVNVFTALSILGAGGAYGYVQWRLGQIKRIAVPGLHKAGHSSQSKNDGSSLAPFSMLVIGSDTRDLGSAGGTQFGTQAEVGGERSDSIILVRIVPKTRSLALLSIPRDTLVPIPGYGTTRINTAFNTGTPSLLVTVLDQDFGIEINHVAVFNFDTFRAVADAVGGVEQYFPSPAKDIYSALHIPAAGCYNLKGDEALAFVRSREYEYYLDGQWQYQLYPESDLARIQRQQAFFKALARKAKAVAPTNPIALNGVIAGITKNLTVDSSFSNSLIIKLAQDFRSANLSTIPSYTYPTVNSTAVPGALDPEMQEGRSVIQQWLDVGQTAPTAPAKHSSSGPKPVITVNPSSVSIEVENGSGVGGQAALAGTDLSDLGYHTTVSGDAPNFGLGTTEIEYAPDSLAAARQLQSQLVGGATLIEDGALTPTVYNLEVVSGQSFNGVIGGSATSSGPTTTSTTVASPAYAGTQTVDPDSSSIYDGVYIPPGLQPGQVPQTCGE